MTKQYLKNITKVFAITFFLLFCHSSISQSAESIEILKAILTNADSIILISHVITAEYGAKETPDWDKRDSKMNLKKWKTFHPAALKFLINSKLNSQVIKESVSLNGSSRIMLSKILVRQVNLNYWAPARCDLPQHSIIFYKGNIQSFIDICFGCQKIHSSKDIAFDEVNVDTRKWSELLTFFKSNGITKIFEEEDKRVSD